MFQFFENNFQYLRGISQDISVFHFDSRRSLSSADRRRSTSPILFVSFTQPCGQHDRKIRTIRKSAARWRGRRARGYRKYFCVRICYMFLVSKRRGDLDLGVCTTSGLAFGEPRRSGDFRKKKRVSTQKISEFDIVQRFSKRKSRSCALHSNEPSSPLSKQELVSCQQLLLWSVENTNFKNSKSQYTQEHEKSQTDHCQSRIRDVDEDPN